MFLPNNKTVINYSSHYVLILFSQTEAALMYDAVFVMAKALELVDEVTNLRTVNLTCDGDQAWAFGSSLYNYLNLVSLCNDRLCVEMMTLRRQTSKVHKATHLSVNHFNCNDINHATYCYC